jgi:hypothetical protein
MIPDAGHLPTLEQTAAVVPPVLGFLTGKDA